MPSINFNPLSLHGERLELNGKEIDASEFQSTLPAWGETASAGKMAADTLFQSTLPAWGETAAA